MPTKYGSAIIVLDENETGLHLSERLGEFGKGMYACPGGMIEENEDRFVAACRELKEETGIIRAPGNLRYYGMTSNQGQKSDHTHWFVTKLMPGEKLQDVEPEKHKAWKLYTFEEALKLPLWLKTKYMLERVIYLQGLPSIEEQRVKRIEELEAAIRKHREATGHNMCWENDEELWSVLRDGVTIDHTPPDHCEFFRKCIEYRESKDKK